MTNVILTNIFKKIRPMPMSPLPKQNILPPIISNENNNNSYNTKPKKILTEDLGHEFEMAICNLYNIDYDGNFKYSEGTASSLANRISKLKNVFPHKLRHTAKNGNKYDFETVGDNPLYLSAKTTKKDGKVCPQVIGQTTKNKFCEFFELENNTTLAEIKEFIENNPAYLLNKYIENTFCCPTVYYNQKKDLAMFITLKQDINWCNNEISFTHKLKNKAWNESSTIKIGTTSIGEFQIHNNRNCIKFRWAFEKLLKKYSDNFDIIEL